MLRDILTPSMVGYLVAAKRYWTPCKVLFTSHKRICFEALKHAMYNLSHKELSCCYLSVYRLLEWPELKGIVANCFIKRGIWSSNSKAVSVSALCFVYFCA